MTMDPNFIGQQVFEIVEEELGQEVAKSGLEAFVASPVGAALIGAIAGLGFFAAGVLIYEGGKKAVNLVNKPRPKKAEDAADEPELVAAK